MPNGQGTPQDWADDRRRSDYRDGVVRRALLTLHPLFESGDAETAHVKADEALCEALIAFGGREIVDAWRLVPKWYA